MKLLLLLSLSLASPFSASSNASESIHSPKKCTETSSPTLAWAISMIKASTEAEPAAIHCEEIKKIQKYAPKEIFITSGRTGGKYIICFSDTKNDPCKHIIGEIKSTFDPSASLANIFNANQSAPKVLNETTERLYLRPSKLMR